MQIGQTIRRLRTERAMTQEGLAELIGVTPQAVSKWESGAGLPDISQVTPLASVFGVSTDVLFGLDGTDEKEKVKQLVQEMWESLIKETGDAPMDDIIWERIDDSYRELLKQFPNNLQLLTFRTQHAVSQAARKRAQGDMDKAQEVFEECEHMAKLVLEHGENEYHVLTAKTSLIRLYTIFEMYEKALEFATMSFSEEIEYLGAYVADVYMMSGDIQKEFDRRYLNVYKTYDAFITSVVALGASYISNAQYDDALEVYSTAMTIEDAVYGNEKLRELRYRFLNIYSGLARAKLGLGDSDGALGCLEELVDTLFIWAAHMNEGMNEHEIPLLRGHGNLTHISDEQRTHMVRPILDTPAFDPLRDHPRFIALLDRVNAMA